MESKKENKTMLLRTVVDREVGEKYAEFAKERFDGNVSQAMRYLMERGYEEESLEGTLDRYFEEHFDPKMDDLEERLAKVTSRGTKAALGNLALMSETVMAICSILRSIDRDVHALMRNADLRVNEDSEGAFDRIHDMMSRHPSQIFCWAWDAGGLMQAQKGSPNFLTATKNLEFRYPEMELD